MRKIRLDLDELTVESFHVAPAGDRAGTVVGQASGQETCDFVACNSLDSGCGGTCFNSCPPSCMSCEGRTCDC